jgi:hypothetical protein
MASRYTGQVRELLPLIAVAACNADRYGAYLHVTSPQPMDRVEFVFGGYLPSDSCDHTTDQHAPVLRRTPMFDNNRPSSGDEMFRRQLGNGDLRMLDGTTDYTLYLDTLVNDPSTPFDDSLGKTVVVVAASGDTTLVGELDDFEIPDRSVNLYDIPLVTVAPTDLERWGGGEERCLRYTRPLASGMVASKFIVPTWDRDCDGFFTQLCYTADGNAIDDDCDPLRFCDVTASDSAACSVPDACVAPGTVGAGGCRLAACTNQAGHLHKVCTAADPFCIDERACTNPMTCSRPAGECVVLDLQPDVECEVPVLKLPKAGGDDGTLCSNTTPPNAPFLTNSPPTTTCFPVDIVPISTSRALGVTVTTPSNPTGCNLELAANNQAVTPGLVTETRVLVSVTLAGMSPGGSLLIDIKPTAIDDCTMASEMTCMPVTPTVHTCQ